MAASNKNSNTQWRIIAHTIIDSGKYFDINKCTFTDELQAIEMLQTNPTLRQKFSEILSKLNKPRERTVELTNKYRKRGNEFFNEISGQNDLAADYYTNAIFSAPKDSVELAIAHLNRAACSVTSNRFYEEGYFDCKEALQFNYPRNRLKRLFERKKLLAGRTHKRDEYNAETDEEMKNMKVQLDNATISDIDEQNSQFNAAFARCLKLADNNENQSKEMENQSERPQQNENVNLNEIFDPIMGRSLITPEAIKEDKLIYTEKAFSFVPRYRDHADAILYSCQCCAKTNILPFPCYNCSRVSYCTPLCVADHEPIHKYECVGYQKNLWIKVGDGHLAFRTFLVGFRDAVEKLIERKKSTVGEVWSSLIRNKHKNCVYGEILRMISHADRLNLNDCLYFALTSQMLTVYLSEYTDFFDTLPHECMEILDLDGWKTLIAAILMRHMAQVVINSKSIFQINLKPPSLHDDNYGYGSYDIRSEDLALVISAQPFFISFFPKTSILNHSCEPNIRSYMDGPHIFVHALRNIDKNEQIFDCYGPHYRLTDKRTRMNILMSEYIFWCKCLRCEEENEKEIYDKYFAYYCPNERCGLEVNMDKIISRWWSKDKTEYSKKVNHQFFCINCFTPLPMNPLKMEKFMLAAKGYFTDENNVTTFTKDQDAITKRLLDYYFSSSKCLGKFHELKTRMAHSILGFDVTSSRDEFFPKLAYITMEMFVNRFERFGAHSLEFIMVTPQAVNILKMAKRIEQIDTSEEMTRDIAKIRKILDVRDMEKSFIVLPQSIRMIFRNAMAAVRGIKLKNDDGTNDLNMQPSTS